MSENIVQPQFKPFRQIPVVAPKDELVITGEEFNIIQNFINSFLAPVNAADAVYKRNMNNGKIVFKYVDESGTEIPKEEIEEQLKQMEEYYKSQRDVMKVSPDEQETPTLAPVKKLKAKK